MRRIVSSLVALSLLAAFWTMADIPAALAADRASVVASGDYKAGSSIYGKALTGAQLNEVADAVASFLNTYISSDMTDSEKVAAACAYLVDTCSYAGDWSKNGANTAWGALIYKEAQCSGYARAFKALCDGMGVGCHYVHADATAINPSHQWNIVEVDGGWYHIDVQAFDDSGAWSAGLFILVSDDVYAAHGFTWDKSALPACPANYSGGSSESEFRKPVPVADKPSSWAIEAVNDAIRLDLCPAELLSDFKRATTRAEFCALGVRLYEFIFPKMPAPLKDFDDTTDLNVRKMAGLGVVNGVGENKFDPDAKITREQAATMLSNLLTALGCTLYDVAPAAFSDNGEISSWAFDAVSAMSAIGVMSGVDDNMFAPKNSYTREQSIVTVIRLFAAMLEGTGHTDLLEVLELD
jgi:hypothetical protein